MYILHLLLFLNKAIKYAFELITHSFELSSEIRISLQQMSILVRLNIQRKPIQAVESVQHRFERLSNNSQQ